MLDTWDLRELKSETPNVMAEFHRPKMKESKSIDDFSGKLSKISSKSSAIAVNIEES